MNKFFKYLLIFLLVCIIIGLGIFCFFFVGKAKTADNIVWGVDFSQMQAESLKLDWKEVYLSLIYELGAKNIKIHTQWDWVEGKKGEYYFDDIDWQIKKAKENNVKIIYVLGLKTGRWPECHIPEWAKGLDEKQQKQKILDYIGKVVARYKNNSNIIYWQVENEPLFEFGECPGWYYKNEDFLKEEVKFVKSLDPSRKIIISDSGEGSMWFDVAKIGDIVGTTLYRGAWANISEDKGFYFNYFFSPVYYSRKALLIKTFYKKDVMCIELQAEPWASRPFYDVELSEQYKSMNLQRIKDNIQYAKETGLDTFYLWGAEWWYWLKEKQDSPEIWNEVKSLFSKK